MPAVERYEGSMYPDYPGTSELTKMIENAVVSVQIMVDIGRDPRLACSAHL